MPQITVEQAWKLALQHHQAGQLPQAESLYRQILGQAPNHANALHLLGVIAHQVGRNDAAMDLISRALAAAPNFPEAYLNLGNVLKDMGKLDEAIAALRQAIALKPNFPEALSNLGNFLKDKGQLDEAITACRRAISLNSAFPEAHNNLGNALRDRAQLDKAIVSFRRAIDLRPGFPEARVNLANALKDQGRLDEAIGEYRQALLWRPSFAEAHGNFASALKDKGELDEAIAEYRQALYFKPNYAEAHNNLANALKNAGRLDEAIAEFRAAMALDPTLAEAHSNLLLALSYHPDSTSQGLLEESRRWAARFAEPVKPFIRPHANDRDPGRRLRVGYVSPDLREHVVGRALLPFLAERDADQFEAICYNTALVPDVMTQRIRAEADRWRDSFGLSAEELAQLIRVDQIDILVDLSGHSSQHRLLTFARKPAPVQVTWLGYPGTTGLSAMDYRLTDACLDPPDPIGLRDALYTERSIRLPHNAFCYQPAIPTTPINPLPALTTGRVTFGCLNNLCKATAPTLDAWIQILRAIPSSTLLLYADVGESRRRIAEQFSNSGIDPVRIHFAGFGGASYFEIYHRIDIALDPFPFTGSTTTCDSIWMGVPVVTLAGPRIVSRLSLTILSTLGLTELAAQDIPAYVQIATELAGDFPRLAHLRSTLRQRLQNSPLMDAPTFARHMESAYRTMWRNWCEGAP